jgi:hypothetical protein
MLSDEFYRLVIFAMPVGMRGVPLAIGLDVEVLSV